MNKLIISIILIGVLISCDKGPGDLKYSETITGGCTAEKGLSLKNLLGSETDSLSYKLVDGNLDIFLGFNGTCCEQFSATSETQGDTIIIEILTTQAGQCNCICFYTYEFKYTGSGSNYKYLVKINNRTAFSGEIKP